MLGGAALGAGIKGITNYFEGQDKEKDDKKAAMRELYNRYLSGGNMRLINKPVDEAPSMEESVGMPLAQAGLGAAANYASQPKLKEGETEPDWYQQAAKGYLGAGR